ncbi:YgeY family selenium metabolism-linked hydrolase [Oceanobacillus neutriphilus]|uniref:Peptidase n=1 Tax=Oceanobacillus neutriphilus TaxID=531815 RepID=A0ABQ2P318_9BACI|nr:YgeY family selenium metabolism-linked hydrolase [Oceanobacillus neutriphilus]GGP16699.1 peptidase [Oceanobacillus neutriphilus]
MLSNHQSNQVIGLCQRLVQIQSYSGKEKQVMEVIKEYTSQNKFDEIITDVFGNVMLVINGNEEGPTVLFDGHVDTVTVQEEDWTVDPFAAEIKDGKIYGRGTSDMKGAVSAMISAAINFAEETDRKFPGKIMISCTVHEECFEGVATRKVSERLKPDYVVIGEATNLNLNRAQRGRAEILVETFGKTAHSSNPEKGINAVNKMMHLLSHIQNLSVPEHDVLGKGILELTDIISSPYPGSSVVPSYCRVTFDRRLLVEETKESVLAPIIGLIEKIKKTDKDFNAKVSYTTGEEKCYTNEIIKSERFFPGWLFNENESFVEKSFNRIKKINPGAKISHYSFCTNGSHFAGEANIPTIGFGPSPENLAHTDDEYIEIEQLTKATEGYFEIMKALTGLEGN